MEGLEEGTPVEEFTDDLGRVVKIVIIKTIVTRTVIKNGVKTVTKEPKEEAVYLIDGKPVEPESITVDGKPVEPKKPEDILSSIAEFVTPMEEIPVESLPFDQGRPVEEFTDDQGRVVRIMIVRTIVTRTVIKNGVETVTKEPKEEVMYLIDGKPVQPESITVGGKPVEPKKPEDILPSIAEFVTPMEEIPVESLPFDQGRPIEEFTDDQGRVVRIVIVRTIVTRTIIKNGVETVTKEPKEEVVYLIDGERVEPESITVGGKPVEAKKPEDILPSELVTRLQEIPVESLMEPSDDFVPASEGEVEFVDEYGQRVRRIVHKTVTTRTIRVSTHPEEKLAVDDLRDVHKVLDDSVLDVPVSEVSDVPVDETVKVKTVQFEERFPGEVHPELYI